MKRMALLALAGLSVAGGTALASSSGALSPFSRDTLPVLVQVDANGGVDSAVPAVALAPEVSRLMVRNLQEMITKPAMRDGRPVPSQFVANLALKTTAAEDGKIGAYFTCVSVSPVPGGRWHWADKDGRELALVEQRRGSSISSRVLHPGARESRPLWRIVTPTHSVSTSQAVRSSSKRTDM